jgi:type IX secretion system PorP/SprF family membrane protein
MSVKKKAVFCLILLFSFGVSEGQETPVNPISYRIFTPFIFNPAIAGSKDYFSVDLLTGWQGKNNSQMLSAYTRYAKLAPSYISSYVSPEFTNIGVGASVYNDLSSTSRTIGFTAAGSYHFALDRRKLSYISVGASGKGINYHYPGQPDEGPARTDKLITDIDLGVYFYSPSAYAGLSAMNILGNHIISDSLGSYNIPITRRFFFLAGYKILINKPLNIVIEPSLIVNADDSLSGEVKDMIEPLLKIYAGNFCLGSYFHDNSKISFFFQYRYPKFFVGSYFELPKNSPFFRKSPTVEFTFGINLTDRSSSSFDKSHW